MVKLRFRMVNDVTDKEAKIRLELALQRINELKTTGRTPRSSIMKLLVPITGVIVFFLQFIQLNS